MYFSQNSSFFFIHYSSSSFCFSHHTSSPFYFAFSYFAQHSSSSLLIHALPFTSLLIHTLPFTFSPHSCSFIFSPHSRSSFYFSPHLSSPLYFASSFCPTRHSSPYFYLPIIKALTCISRHLMLFLPPISSLKPFLVILLSFKLFFSDYLFIQTLPCTSPVTQLLPCTSLSI